MEKTQKGNDCMSWEKDAEQVWQKKDVSDNDLKRLLMKIYYGTSLIAFEESESRELYRNYIGMEERPAGIIYSVDGTPAKGTVLIPDIEHEEVFYYDRGRFKQLHNHIKYKYVCGIFRKDASMKTMEIFQRNPLPKKKESQTKG